MNIAANTAVARDSPVVAPRAPKTVPDAPEPKPAPASAPLPRCSRTRPTIPKQLKTWTMVRMVRNMIENYPAKLKIKSKLIHLLRERGRAIKR